MVNGMISNATIDQFMNLKDYLHDTKCQLWLENLMHYELGNQCKHPCHRQVTACTEPTKQ